MNGRRVKLRRVEELGQLESADDSCENEVTTHDGVKEFKLIGIMEEGVVGRCRSQLRDGSCNGPERCRDLSKCM